MEQTAAMQQYLQPAEIAKFELTFFAIDCFELSHAPRLCLPAILLFHVAGQSVHSFNELINGPLKLVI